MSKIVFSEGVKAFFVGFLIGTFGGCPLHKLYNTVADKAAHLVKAPFGKGEFTKSVIYRRVQVAQGIKKCTVKVKNYCFININHSFLYLL